MNLQKITRLYVVIAPLIAVSLIVSGFATKSFANSQTQFNSITTRGESQETIRAACQQLHRPILVRSFSSFMISTLLMAVVGIIIAVVVFKKSSLPRKELWMVIIITIITIIVFFGVQIWEPDYTLAICSL